MSWDAPQLALLIYIVHYFYSHRQSAEILPCDSTTAYTSFHASAAAEQVESEQAAKGPAAHHMEQMKCDSERLRRYRLLMEDWLVTMCVVGAYSGRIKKHT